MSLDDRLKYIKHSISADLWRQARAHAILQGKPVGQWLNELIEWALKTGWTNEELESLGIKDSQRPGDK